MELFAFSFCATFFFFPSSGGYLLSFPFFFFSAAKHRIEITGPSDMPETESGALAAGQFSSSGLLFSSSSLLLISLSSLEQVRRGLRGFPLLNVRDAPTALLRERLSPIIRSFLFLFFSPPRHGDE